MSRTAYARQHGINNKTFWHLCRAFSAADARGPAPADNRPAILPVTLSVSDTATLKLQCACVTASPAAPPSSGSLTCAEPSFPLARPRAC
ncbi:hypothetical protein RS157_08720 [Escherichia coli]|uniref:hypothetical protein n=1 Tax=Escherichia coli TaxID=562 RepID=UPI0028E7CA2F|nr:hypothetical protein [Escherichia coli]WNU23720.1 hypothetical protein RS157_08720 [Escherichia coli]